MRDRAAASIWVLIVDGLPDGRHVSLHASRDDARDQFTALKPADIPSEDITATVAERALGSPRGAIENLSHTPDDQRK
ncbi:hypothetical protein [Amycolatopsis sp. NPDC051903]|uniref:hypothetical protein n=1 Tax=Amycolatopsis sp. NPDC051903 TaxID=3363936 RepID=UPI0037901BC9